MENTYSDILIQTNVKNKNGRVYPPEILNREILQFEEKIKKGMAFGELGHPDTFNTTLANVSHVITKITATHSKIPRKKKKQMKKMNTYTRDLFYATYMVLDTPMGELAKTMIQDLVPSPRGTGSIDKNGIIQDDYNLLAIDLINKNEKA